MSGQVVYKALDLVKGMPASMYLLEEMTGGDI